MLDFFKRLLPFFEKRKINQQLDATRQRLDQVFKPTCLAIAEAKKGSKTTSEFAKRFERNLIKELQRIDPLTARGNYYDMLLHIAGHLETKLTKCEQYVTALFQDKNSTQGLTYKQLEILRVLDLFAFAITYSMKSIHYTLWEEGVKAGHSVECPLTPAEVKWLQQNETAYFGIVKVICLREKEFAEAIDSTSDLIVSEVDDAIRVGVRTDPLRLGFCPGIGSLILFVREQWILHETKVYESNKLRLQSIQLQLQLLQEQQANDENNEAVKRQIDYITQRIKDLENDIRKYEEKAGV